jgi:hypothetical protein
MQTNIKVLAWLHVILGIMGMLIGCVIVVIMLSAGLISGDNEAMGILTIISMFGIGLTLLLSAPTVVAGIGLLQYRSWARVLALILALFNLFAFPHGTVFGIYTFVSLLHPDAAALFTK